MHVPTLMLLNITMSAVVGIALMMTTLRRHRELSLLAAGLGAHALGYSLLSLRGQISDILSVVVANTLLSITPALLTFAIYQFQRRPAPGLLIWAPVVAIAVSFSWYLDDFQTRVLLSGVLLSVQLVMILVPMVARQRETVGRGQYVAMFGFLMALAAMVVRVHFLLGGNGAPPVNLFDQSSSYSLIFYGTLLSILLITVGMIHMVQERTQQELYASEAQYRQLIELADEGVTVLGNQHVRFVNAKTAQLLGIAQDQLLGSAFVDYVYADDRPLAVERYRARLSGEVDQEAYDLRLLTAHAGPRWFRISGVRIQWDGEPATLTFISDINERKVREDEARQLAYHDELTGLPNRRLLVDRIGQALALAARTDHHLALLFIDLDKLKILNDHYGHQAGDMLLVETARRLSASIRESDTVARLGGDEFVVLLQGLDDDVMRAGAQAQAMAEKIMAVLKAPYRLQVSANDSARTENHQGSGSIGIHVFRSPAEPVDVLLEKADAAMYWAKQRGPGLIGVSAQTVAVLAVRHT